MATRIDHKTINDLIVHQIEISKRLPPILPDYCLSKGDIDGFNYSTNKGNAFVFTKEDIDDFFHPQQGRDGTLVYAKYLLVVIGAQLANNTPGEPVFKKGDLTVIAVAANLNEDGKTYDCLNIEQPGSEHTPLIGIPGLNPGALFTTLSIKNANI